MLYDKQPQTSVAQNSKHLLLLCLRSAALPILAGLIHISGIWLLTKADLGRGYLGDLALLHMAFIPLDVRLESKWKHLTSPGLCLELAHCNFCFILLAKVSHKTSSDSKSGEMDSVS